MPLKIDYNSLPDDDEPVSSGLKIDYASLPDDEPAPSSGIKVDYNALPDDDDGADVNPTWEGIKGALKGVAATIPFVPVTSPIQDAPAPNAAGKFGTGLEQFVRPVTRAIGTTMAGAAVGGVAGVAGANMADKAIQIGAEQGTEGFTERPIAAAADIALAGATSALPFKFGSASTAAAAEAIEQGAKRLPTLLGLAGKNAAVDTAAGVVQTGADAAQRGENPIETAKDSLGANLGISLAANLLGARGAVKSAAKPRINLDEPVKPRLTPEELAAKNQEFVDEMQAIPGTVDAKITVDGQKPVEASATPAKVAFTPELVYDHTYGRHSDMVDVERTNAKLPPVPEGHVRLFRGESGNGDRTSLYRENLDLPEGDFYTPDPRYAYDFAMMQHREGRGKKISYVDVPKYEADKYHLSKFPDMAAKLPASDENSYFMPHRYAEDNVVPDSLSGKQPWQMTSSEFAQSGQVGIFPHETIIRRAIDRGEPVPQNVLDEYPKLSGNTAQGEQMAESPVQGAKVPGTASNAQIEAIAEPVTQPARPPIIPTGTGKVPPTEPPKLPPADLAGDGDGFKPPQKYVGSQNATRMPVNEQEFNLLKDTYAKEAAEINKLRGEERVSENVVSDAMNSKVMNWTPEQAASAAKNPSKFDMTDSDQFALRSRAMAELRRATQNPEDKEAFKSFQSFMRASQVMATKAGRELKSYSIQAKAWDAVLTTKDRTAVKLSTIFKEQGEIPEKFKQRLLNLKPDDVTQANQLIADAAHTKHGKYWWVHPYIYFNLLSNPITHLGNAGANLGQTVGAAAVKGVAGAINLPRSIKNREVDMAELPAYLKGVGNGVSDGAARAIYAWKNGFTQKQAQNLEGTQFAQFRGMASILNTPGRALQAADEFFRALNANGEAHSLAVRQAKKDIAAGAKGSLEKLTKFHLENPTDDVLKQVDVAAARSVFQEDLPSWMKKLEQFIGHETKNGVQPIKFIQPFIQVPFNVTKQVLENSPLGFLGAKGAPNKSEAVARAMIGTAPLVFLMPLIADDTIEIVGPIPKDSREREKFYAEKKRPWSVRIGGRYVDLRYFGAFAAPLAMAGAYGRALKTNKKNPDTNVAEQMVYNTINYMGDASFFTGFSSFAGMVDDPERRGSRFAANLGSQWVPGSGLQRFVNQLPSPVGDKWQREAETAWEKVAGGTVAARAVLPIRLNSAGEKVERSGPFPKAQKDSLLSELEKHDIGFGAPSRKQQSRTGEKVELEKGQYRALLEGVNAPVATQARELVASERYQKAQPAQQKALLESILNRRDGLFNQVRHKQGLDFLKPR